MARIELRLPDWLKNRAKEWCGGNISQYIRSLIIRDLPCKKPIKRIPSVKNVKDRCQK